MADPNNDLEDEPDEPVPSKRVKVTLSVQTIGDLKTLKKGGRHGTTMSGIMASYIEGGVRQAVKDGYLK